MDEGRSKYERGIKVRESGFENIEAARAAAWAWKNADYGRTIVTGGVDEDGGWFEGTIVVDDDNKNVIGNFGCGRCALTGKFVTYVENGVPKGPGGSCFRCNGKGYHDQADRKRNQYHDEHAIVDALRYG